MNEEYECDDKWILMHDGAQGMDKLGKIPLFPYNIPRAYIPAQRTTILTKEQGEKYNLLPYEDRMAITKLEMEMRSNQKEVLKMLEKL